EGEEVRTADGYRARRVRREGEGADREILTEDGREVCWDGWRVEVEVHVVGGTGQARGAVVEPGRRRPVGAAEAGGGVPEGAVAGVITGPVVVAGPGRRRGGAEERQQGDESHAAGHAPAGRGEGR